MPKIMSVSGVLDMDIGQPIPLLKGYIKQHWGRKKGRSKYGEWSFENFLLEDVKDQDSTIKVKLEGMPASGFDEGDLIIIAAHEGGKGWSGVELDEEEYNGKTDLLVKVKGKAEVMDAKDFDASDTDDRKPQREERKSQREERQPRREERKPSREERKPRSDRREYIPDEDEGRGEGGKGKDSEEAFIGRLYQLGNLYLRAYGMAVSVCNIADKAGLPEMKPEQVQAATYTLFAAAKQRDTAACMPSDEITIPGDGGAEEDPEPKRKSKRTTKAKTRDEDDPEPKPEDEYPED